MNLLFVCTSLQPGRDGVGDYSRLLASACADAGHTCALLAINDTHAREPVVRHIPHAFQATGKFQMFS